jgi:hypothetical protein
MLVPDATIAMNMTMLEFACFGSPHASDVNHVLEHFAREFVVEIHGHALASTFNNPSSQRISRPILREELRTHLQVRTSREARGWYGPTFARIGLAIGIFGFDSHHLLPIRLESDQAGLKLHRQAMCVPDQDGLRFPF